MNRRIILSGVIASLLTFGLTLSLFAQEDRGVIHYTNRQGEKVGWYEGSYALVIGISNYTGGWPKLPGVQRDVEEVKTVLEVHGFNVVVKMDLDRIALDQAFTEFISHYGHASENRLLFYFAGHGHTVKKSFGEELGYIVPVDAPDPAHELPNFQSKAIAMKRIEEYALEIDSKHALFVFDSCFSGSIFSLSRAVPEIISYHTSELVRQFITSGSADEKVPDKSIFRAQFVRALRGEADANNDGYVTGTELGKFLQDTVVNYSHNAQHPQYGKIRNPNLDKGDFVFKLSSSFPTSTLDNVFRITHIVVKNTHGKIIEPVDDIYNIKVGETVTITVEFTNPDDHGIDVGWDSHCKRIPPISTRTTTHMAENRYTARELCSDGYVSILAKDTATGDTLQKYVKITVVQ